MTLFKHGYAFFPARGKGGVSATSTQAAVGTWHCGSVVEHCSPRGGTEVLAATSAIQCPKTGRRLGNVMQREQSKGHALKAFRKQDWPSACPAGQAGTEKGAANGQTREINASSGGETL